MRAVIISDTHGALQRADYTLQAVGPFDLIVHAGDHWLDAERLGELFEVPVKAVAGNCDPENCGPDQAIFTWAECRILLVHGNHHHVKDGLSLLRTTAQRSRAQLAIFGHTHQWHLERDANLVLLNPGSVAHPRSAAGNAGLATVALLEQQADGCISVRVLALTDLRTLAAATITAISTQSF